MSMRLIPVVLFSFSLAAQTTPKPTFVRDVMPIFNKAGCTSGPCHGAAKGKNGFKLSLRGYDPEFDYRAVLHDMSGRRYNRAEPARSLVLLKPTQQLPHGGGARFEPDSLYYKTVLAWLEGGAEYGDPASAMVTKLELKPSEIFTTKTGHTEQLAVTVHYADGSTRDVTKEALYTSAIPDLAEASEGGAIKALRKGEASVLVRYEGRLAVLNVTNIEERPEFAWTASPEHNFIDRLVNDKLKKLRMLPSELTSDAEFLRRVSLDLTGLAPTPEQARAFLADKTETRKKRALLVDRLLERPEFVNHWSVKWGDLLQVNRAKLGDKGVWTLRDWIRESIGANKPYDQLVRELVTARGSTFRNPPANFLRFTKEPKIAMETTTQLFLGVRMVCAQCHDHPFEQWTQNQYFHLSAFFGGVGTKAGMDSQEEIVFEKREDAEILHPKDGRVMSAKLLFGAEKFAVREDELRESLAEWLTSKENPFFAKAMANRLWSYFTGRGIIEPVDDIRASNPPSNPALLDALTRDFIDHNFDLRHLMRTIVNSRTYQLSYRTNTTNARDEINFSHALPRRLAAEQLLDAVHIATGTKTKLKDVPLESRAQDFPDPSIDRGGFLDLFGRPERQTSCECERRSDVSLVQALNLLNGATIADAIADSDGRIAKLILKGATDRRIVEDLYMASLGRPPDSGELDRGQTYLAGGNGRAERAQDLLWALLNSNAFLFNR